MIRLTDEQWERIRDHFPEENIADGRPGRKPTPTRCVLEAVLWILNTGAQWHMLPQSYPNYKTVHRRFQTWCRDEVLRRVLTDVANELRDSGALNEEECFIDATFVMAKGGGPEIGMSGLMSGDRKRSVAIWPKPPRLSSTLHAASSSRCSAGWPLAAHAAVRHHRAQSPQYLSKQTSGARLTRLLRARSGSASSAAANVFPIPAFSFQGSDSVPAMILAK